MSDYSATFKEYCVILFYNIIMWCNPILYIKVILRNFYNCTTLPSRPLPFPSLLFSFSPSILSPSLPPPFFPLEVGSLKRSYGIWGSAVSSPAGFAAEPQPKSNLVLFSLKIWHMVTRIVMIFLRIIWPQW